MQLSVIIPMLNEAACLGATLQALRRDGALAEIICVDGGSQDASRAIARAHGATIVDAARGRGLQLHRGASVAGGDTFWFLHADTVPACAASAQITAALADPAVAGGNFRLQFSGGSRAARFMNALYPRLAWLGLRYGDSGIFVRRAVYEEAGGFRALPIFEDLDLLRRIRRRGRLVTLPGPLVTSSRRFENAPFLPVFLRWAGLQLLYWCGCDPVRLGRLYYPEPRVPRSRPSGETG